ncbi:nucleoside diphosphate pyrophosphatase [Psychromonas ingrahamii 37]|uniref:ADP-ribose pyrophosphatase n=1 Tax=Psychromonas ingrahamii (strain DSM 17664 / CCUG 51855 / 37) TaxID=357804 RepID=A1SZY0_PSYIN|nr:ADP-ribose diphosphatase [Psychromonas ingrahamii]ABM05045.1 nucleoside diphosphate pyrophosphatase [Psychromonas ingrahamii 37]
MNVHSGGSVFYNQDDVQVLSKESLYKGFFECNLYTLKHKLFAGGWSPEIKREFFERGHAAVLLPYDVKNDTVVLIEQFRLGAMAGDKSPWLLELVAGIIEQDEVAEQVAKREAFEEAGLTVKSCQFMLNYLVSPGGTTEQIDLFIANVDSSEVGGLYGLAHEGEDIRAHVVPRETAYQWVKEGKIYNAATIIALQWLELNRDNLTI